MHGALHLGLQIEGRGALAGRPFGAQIRVIRASIVVQSAISCSVSTTTSKVDQVVLSSLEQHIPHDREADIGDCLEILVGLEMSEHLFL